MNLTGEISPLRGGEKSAEAVVPIEPALTSGLGKGRIFKQGAVVLPIVTITMKAVNHITQQMYLPGAEEWGVVGPTGTGADVYRNDRSGVRQEWLSVCRKERALTVGLMDAIADPVNLTAAMRQVVSNAGAAGVDGMTVKQLESWYSSNWKRLSEDLKAGRYHLRPLREVQLPKPNGGQRVLGIPTVKDRLVQQAISQVLTIRYDNSFSDHSYGFRPKRSAHGALHKASGYVAQGKRWVVDIDLEKFFDMVNHDRLMWLLGTRIGDRTLLRLIGRFLKAGMLKGGLAEQRVKGTPQGSPLSPLLSNIVLDELDKVLEQRGHSFVRYADDLIILVGSKEAAKRVLSSTTRLIEERLKLKVNAQKSKIRKPYEVNFLGHSFLHEGKLGLSKQSEARFKAKLKQITKRNRGISLERLVKELNPILRGWLGYFRNARMKGRLGALAGWLNRKIRCFRLKQCKRAISIARFLNSLGVRWNRCWLTAGSSKGWYRLSNTPATNEGMDLNWIRSIGLYDLQANYLLTLKETAQYDKRTLGGVRGQQG